MNNYEIVIERAEYKAKTIVITSIVIEGVRIKGRKCHTLLNDFLKIRNKE